MSISIEGTVKRAGMGSGTWAISTPKGETYEIYQGAPAELLQVGQTVEVQGTIRDDVMTLAMIGPVLEVESFQVIAPD